MRRRNKLLEGFVFEIQSVRLFDPIPCSAPVLISEPKMFAKLGTDSTKGIVLSILIKI